MEKSEKVRRYPVVPRVGVAGVVVFEERVLLIKRGREPGRGEWNLPGGLVEVGETLREAVAREVEEETGLQVAARELLAVGDRIIRDEAGRVMYHYVLLDYLCEVTGGELASGSDAEEARWMTPRELEEIPLPRSIRDVLARAEEKIGGFREIRDKEKGEEDG